MKMSDKHEASVDNSHYRELTEENPALNNEYKSRFPKIVNTHNVARWLHEEYNDAAKSWGWGVQNGTDVDFDELPNANRLAMLQLGAPELIELTANPMGD